MLNKKLIILRKYSWLLSFKRGIIVKRKGQFIFIVKINDEEAKIVANLTEIKNKLNDKIIEFKVKTGKDDRVFGTVSSKQISDKINELGYDIDKKCILIDTPLSSLGTYKVKIKLHKKVEFNINIKLIK